MSVLKADSSGHQVSSIQGPGMCGPQNGFADLVPDAQGNVYLTGTTNVASTGYAAGGFAAKLNAEGSKFLYVTFLPANLLRPSAIRTDAQGNAYIAGTTADLHPFVTKLTADGSTFGYTIEFPGSGTSAEAPDSAFALAVNSDGSVVVTGQTSSPDFPVTADAVQSLLAGAPSGFVTKLDAGGKIVFSTLLGGAGGATGHAIQLDAAGNIYVAGEAGANFPTTPGNYQPVAEVPLWSEERSAFVAKLRPDASAIAWGTYTIANDFASPIPLHPVKLAVSASGDIYLAANTGAGALTPTTSAPQPCFGIAYDVALIHLNAQGNLADSTYLGASRAVPTALSLSGDGTVLVAATGDSGPLVAQIRFGQSSFTADACISPDVVNAASFSSGNGVVSPGEFVSMTGFGIGPDAGLSYQPGPQGQVPTSLSVVQVTFNGIPAPLLYVQSRQVDAQVPFEIGSPTSPATKVAVTLTYNSRTFGPFTLDATSVGPPGIFRLQPGVSTLAAALNQDYTGNGPSNPAARGSYVAFFDTGYGPLAPPCTTGGLNPPVAVPLYFTGSPISIPVQYGGSAPTLLCGIEQFNLQVPLSAAPGPLLLSPYVNPGYGVTIYVK